MLISVIDLDANVVTRGRWEESGEATATYMCLSIPSCRYTEVFDSQGGAVHVVNWVLSNEIRICGVYLRWADFEP